MCERIRRAAWEGYSRKRGIIFSLLLGSAVSFPAFAQAQDVSGGQDSGQAVNASDVNDIIVTAQKQAQSVQKVPITISVVSGDALQQRGVASIEVLSTTMPTVRVAEGGTSNRLFIRGIGSGDNASFEQSVARFTDNVYNGRAKTTASSLLDIERVEVLKGPQTLYFGNNAIGGAINVTTRRPSKEFDGYLRVFYMPSEREYAMEAAQSLPVNDELQFRVAAIAAGTDGWMRDTGIGGRAPNRSDLAGRVSMVWTPSQVFKAFLRADIGRSRGLGIADKMINCPPPAGFPGPGLFCQQALAAGQDTSLANSVRASTPGRRADLDTEEYLANLDYDLGPVTLTSTTAYRHHYFDSGNDLDGVAADNASVARLETYGQFSQELRLTSTPGTPLEYMVGAYFQRSKLTSDQHTNYPYLSPTIRANPAFAAIVPYLPFSQRNPFTEKATNYSVFGALTWHVTDRLSATAGLRWTSVHKDFEQSVGWGGNASAADYSTPIPSNLLTLADAVGAALGLGRSSQAELSRTDKDWAPSFRVQYEIDPDVMVFASYANGFKGGGFQGNNLSGDPAQLPFGPESVNSYELGVKSRLFDRRLLFNVSLFRADYSDLQVTFQQFVGNGVRSFVANAASSRSQGVDLDAQLRVTDRLRLGVQAVYLDSKYLSYTNAGATALQLVQGIRVQDLSGKPTIYAPKWSGDANLEYTVPLAGLELKFAGDMYFSSKYNASPTNDPLLDQAGYTKFGAVVSLSDPRKRWEVSVIGRNLTDKTVLSFGNNVVRTSGSNLAVKEPPRSVAVQLKLNW